ncbi:hypothetical protein [Anaeromicrobium sp.]|uniref:hypothetical protein n=1 Tax=Anaeromicrobium sp. TaxID=1929132 RepID=UPI0025F6749F|nr:hypothetical protein [Anaeromicrobium sp.]
MATNRTIIVIAHHLKTIESADKIIIFDKKQIVEKEKHCKLLKNNGLYKELWNVQKKAEVWSF